MRGLRRATLSPPPMFTRIVSIITPVILIILIGWLYGRRAQPDMTGINLSLIHI